MRGRVGDVRIVRRPVSGFLAFRLNAFLPSEREAAGDGLAWLFSARTMRSAREGE